MVFVITVLVCITLAALALWTTGWGKPQRRTSTTEDDHIARSQQANWRGGIF